MKPDIQVNILNIEKFILINRPIIHPEDYSPDEVGEIFPNRDPIKTSPDFLNRLYTEKDKLGIRVDFIV